MPWGEITGLRVELWQSQGRKEESNEVIYHVRSRLRTNVAINVKEWGHRERSHRCGQLLRVRQAEKDDRKRITCFMEIAKAIDWWLFCPGSKHPGKVKYTVWKTGFEIDERYRPIKPVGKGAYGVVASAKDTERGENVAIKKVTKPFENAVDARRTLREVKLLRHFRHENLVALLNIMRPPSYAEFHDVYLVYELMDTDLNQIIKSPQELTDDHIQYFIYQVLRGLKYIHSAHVLHRDLKPSNLLLNANCDLKICDFGLARKDSEQGFKTEYVVTRWYRAPELLVSQEVRRFLFIFIFTFLQRLC